MKKKLAIVGVALMLTLSCCSQERTLFEWGAAMSAPEPYHAMIGKMDTVVKTSEEV